MTGTHRKVVAMVVLLRVITVVMALRVVTDMVHRIVTMAARVAMVIRATTAHHRKVVA